MGLPVKGEVCSYADQSFEVDCPLTECCAMMCTHTGCCHAKCRSTTGARTQDCHSLGSCTKDYHAKCSYTTDYLSECSNAKKFLSEHGSTKDFLSEYSNTIGCDRKGSCTKYSHARGSSTKDFHPAQGSTLTKYHWTIAVLLLIIPPQTTAQNNSVCLNATSSLTIPNYTWDLTATLAVSFSACSDSGTLLTTSSSTTQELRLALSNSSVVFAWNIGGQSGNSTVYYSVNKNSWYMVKMEYIGGDLNLTLLQGTKAVASAVLVANSTFNSFLLNVRYVVSIEFYNASQAV